MLLCSREDGIVVAGNKYLEEVVVIAPTVGGGWGGTRRDVLVMAPKT